MSDSGIIVRRENASIVTSSSVAISAGQTISPPLESLNAPFRSAMWIDEICWTLIWGDVDNPNYVGATSGFGISPFLWARFNLGRLQLSEKYIPLWNYVPTYDAMADVGFHPKGIIVADSVLVENRRWVLPKPLYVPAGSVVVPSYQLVSSLNSSINFGATPITVRTFYRGRIAYQKRPRHIDVPFVGAFLSIGDSPLLQSTEQDLRNPYDQQIDVQRLIGRRYADREVASTFGAGALSVPPNINVDIKDGDGYTMAQQVPFDLAFDMQRSAWTYKGKLGPKSMYSFKMVPSAGVAISTNPVTVSFVGSRRETMEAV